MRHLIWIAAIVVFANAAAVGRYRWNRSEVRSEFELSEQSCYLRHTTRNRSLATLHCTLRSDLRTHSGRRELSRLGYAALTIAKGQAGLSGFARTPADLRDKGAIVVPATQGNGAVVSDLPPMPVRNPPPQHLTRTFRAKIRIGRNYEPWLIELRAGN